MTKRSNTTYWIAFWARSAGATEDARQALAQVPFTAQQ